MFEEQEQTFYQEDRETVSCWRCWDYWTCWVPSNHCDRTPETKKPPDVIWLGICSRELCLLLYLRCCQRLYC